MKNVKKEEINLSIFKTFNEKNLYQIISYIMMILFFIALFSLPVFNSQSPLFLFLLIAIIAYNIYSNLRYSYQKIKISKNRFEVKKLLRENDITFDINDIDTVELVRADSNSYNKSTYPLADEYYFDIHFKNEESYLLNISFLSIKDKQYLYDLFNENKLLIHNDIEIKSHQFPYYILAIFNLFVVLLFISFVIISNHLGGTCYQIIEGKYYLSNHGVATEVNKDIYIFMQVYEPIALYSVLTCFLFNLIRGNMYNKNRKPMLSKRR